jgi:hypothetical protein
MIVRAYFYDEAPAIGQGWRRAIVEREGRIWVRLINPNTFAVCKVRRSIWDKIEKRSSEQSKRELKKKGMSYVQTIDTLALGVQEDKPQSVEHHKAKVSALKKRVLRALNSL